MINTLVKYFLILHLGLNNLALLSQNIDSLKTELTKAKHDTIRCQILNEIIEAETDDTVWPKYNIELLDVAQKKLNAPTPTEVEKNKFLYFKSIALINIGYLESIKGNNLQAIDVFEQSLKIRIALNNKIGITECLLNLGDQFANIYQEEKAYAFYKKALELTKETNDKEGMATLLQAIGSLLEGQGRIPEAIDNYVLCLKVSTEIQDLQAMARANNNLGTLFTYDNNFDKALNHYEKSYAIYQNLDNKLDMFSVLNNLGVLCDKMGKHHEAINYFNKNLKFSKDIGYKNGIALSLNNIGASHFYMKDYKTALKFYTEALEIREGSNNKEALTVSLNCIGNVYFANGDYAKSVQYNLRALEISQEIKQPKPIRDAALRLQDAYTKLNQPAKALEMFKLYIKMRDSINNEQTRKAGIKSQFQIEFNEKEREVKLKAETEKKILEQKSTEERKQKNIIIYSVLACFILVIVFSFFIFRSLQKNKAANKIITQQKREVEESKKEITDSIMYAKRIQFALLAGDTLLKQHLPEHFVFFKPKDVVSGDFYWGTPTTEGFIFITADCTGHGVPGAFMSLLNISKLSQTIIENKITRPDLILNTVRTEIINALNAEGTDEESKDGMDAVLCKLNIKNMTLEYAAANNAFYIIRNNEILHCKADKMPVGKGHDDSIAFTYNEIALQKGDTIYTFTDGYADQFGGPKGKKFKYKQLEDLLLKIHTQAMPQQQTVLEETFYKWKGHLEQVDDVCIIGVRV